MAKQSYLLIDGYNLLFQSGLAQNLTSPGGLQRARRALIGRLAILLTPDQQFSTTIVFDSRHQRGEQPTTSETNSPITIAYATEFDSADDMIAHLLAKHPAPRQVLVVSADRRVREAAKRRRAESIDSESWWEQLQSRAPGAGDSSRTSTDRTTDPVGRQSEFGRSDVDISPEERQRWLDEFGD